MFHPYIISLERKHQLAEAQRQSERAQWIAQAKANGTYSQSGLLVETMRFLFRQRRVQPVPEPIARVSPARSTQC